MLILLPDILYLIYEYIYLPACVFVCLQFLIHIVEKGCLHDATRESEVNETESCLGRKESKETSSTNLEHGLEVSNDEVCLIYDRHAYMYIYIFVCLTL